MLCFDSGGDPVGGSNTILGSVEARIYLGKNFELAPFYDIGSLEDLAGTSESSGFRSSLGLGLRYITPIGPIGLMYGLKLDKMDNERVGRFHFAIGYTF